MGMLIDDVRRFIATAETVQPTINEAETEAQIVLPLLHLLGWSESGRAAIRRQVSTHTLFTDLQLVFDTRPLCVIEVKRVYIPLFLSDRDARKGVIASFTKQGRAAFDQVLGYAVSDGIPFAWVTNGRQHIVFRVQQLHVPIESRLIFVAADTRDLLAQFDQLERLAPRELRRLYLIESPPVGRDVARGESAEETAYFHLVSLCTTASGHQLRYLADQSAVAGKRVRPTLKYSASTFVTRPEYEATFDKFWQSSEPVLMFSGEAGVGKTSILCHLARTIQGRVGVVPCIFRDGSQVASDLGDALHDTLSEFTQNQSPHDLEVAIDCVEDHVLGSSPFQAVFTLPASEDNNLQRQITILRNLPLDACDAGAILADTTRLLAWVADLVSDPIVAWRLRFIADAPTPPAPSTVRSVLRSQAAAVARYAPEQSASMQEISPDLWNWCISLLDGARRGVLDSFDAYAALSAFSLRQDLPDLPEEAGWSGHCRALWLGPVLQVLTDLPPSHLVNAPRDVRRVLVRLLTITAVPKFLIIVDAINESSAPGLLATSLVAVSERLRGRLAKLVVSCRTPDVRFFDPDAFRQLRFSPDSTTTAIDAFGTQEIALAWAYYREAYDISGTMGPSLRELCRNPLILRLLCESFAGSVAPDDDIRIIEIFDAYWKRKIEGTVDGRARAIVLRRLAEVAHEYYKDATGDGGAVVPLYRCVELIKGGTAVLDALISEAVVVFLSPVATGQSGVRFMYESFHEYVLALNLRDRYNEDLRGAVETGIADASGDRLLRGATAYVLLWLDQQGHDVSRWVVRMYSRGFQSEAVAVAAKLRNVKATTAIVKILSGLSLAGDQALVLARGLAKHVRAMRTDALGEALGGALLDPRRAVFATKLAVALLDGSRVELQAEARAFLVGFRRIWELGVVRVGQESDIAKDFLKGAKRSRRVIEIGLSLSGNRRLSTLRWAPELEDPVGSPIAVALGRHIHNVGLEFLRGDVTAEEPPLNAIAVAEWIVRIQRDSARSEHRRWWSRTAEQFWRYLRGVGGSKRHGRILVFDLVGNDENLSSLINSGSYIVALPVGRLLRVVERCRGLLRMLADTEPTETAHLIVAAILSALAELATLFSSERQPDTALLWLGDLRETCLDVIARDLTADGYQAQAARRALCDAWREILWVGGELASDVLATTARARVRV